MTRDKGRPISLIVFQAYEEFDRKIAPALARQPVSCTKGCHGCCHLLVLSWPSEGAAIAEHIINRQPERLEELLPRLRTNAFENCYEGLSEANYARQVIPCMFLADGLCSIYASRPSACRYHFVISPPEDCDPRDPKETTCIDFYQAKEACGRLDCGASSCSYRRCTSAPQWSVMPSSISCAGFRRLESGIGIMRAAWRQRRPNMRASASQMGLLEVRNGDFSHA